MSTATIEAIDLAAMDWAPACEVEYVSARGSVQEVRYPCDAAAEFIIEVRHCTPYRLFACQRCANNKPSDGWTCRRCEERYPAPLVIGKAS